jgi:hypothetical protein
MQRRTFKRLIVAGVFALGIVAAPATAASAHVHGITPLLRCGSELDGADRTDTTPAAAANGGPITGLIPRDVGNAPLTVGDGGFSAPACDASGG